MWSRGAATIAGLAAGALHGSKWIGGYRVTTPERTAFDLGRFGTSTSAVARLDALVRAMVGVEYDGDHHRSDRRQYVRDIRRQELVEELGWRLVRVVAEDHPTDVLQPVRRALARRKSALR